MPFYVIEIMDRPVLVFSAGDIEEALAFADSDAMANDLMLFHHNGVPLWDGESDYIVKESSEVDAAIWEKAFSTALQDGGARLDDRSNFVVFLLEVTNECDDQDGGVEDDGFYH